MLTVDAERIISDGTLPILKAVELSGLSRTTLYGMMERGELPFTKVGKRRLIPRRALMDLLASGLVSGNVGK